MLSLLFFLNHFSGNTPIRLNHRKVNGAIRMGAGGMQDLRDCLVEGRTESSLHTILGFTGLTLAEP